MKKLFLLILCVMSIFVISSCKKEKVPEKVSAPENVTVSETGYITWDAVEGATKYFVVINGATYESSTNNFQIKNIDDDVTYTIQAVSKDGVVSENNQTGTFKGRRTVQREENIDDFISYLGEEASEFDKSALAEAMGFALDRGMSYEKFKGLLAILELNDQALIQSSLIAYNVTLHEADYQGFGILLTYFAEIYLRHSLDTIENVNYEPIDTIIKEINKNKCEFGVSLGNMLRAGMNTYVGLSSTVIPELMQIATSENLIDQVDHIIRLKNIMVIVLENNKVSQTDLAKVMATLKENFVPLAKAVAEARGDQETFMFEQLQNLLNEVKPEELSTTILMVYQNILTYAKKIDGEKLNKILSAESPELALIAMLMESINLDLSNVKITKDQLASLINLVYPLIKSSLGTDAETLQEALQFTSEEYDRHLQHVTNILNSLIAFIDTSLKDTEIKALMLKALEYNAYSTNYYDQFSFHYVPGEELPTDVQEVLTRHNITLPEDFPSYYDNYTTEIKYEENKVIVKTVYLYINHIVSEVNENDQPTAYTAILDIDVYENTYTNLDSLIELVFALLPHADSSALVANALSFVQDLYVTVEDITEYEMISREDVQVIAKNFIEIIEAFKEYDDRTDTHLLERIFINETTEDDNKIFSDEVFKAKVSPLANAIDEILLDHDAYNKLNIQALKEIIDMLK